MLKDGNVFLRPFYENDAIEFSQLANNKKIWDNLRDFIPFPYSLDDAISFIHMTQGENPPMTFAIEHLGKLCGVIGLVGQSDIYKKTAEIGYWIGEPFWNKGIATIAVKLMTAYCFSKLDFVRIHTGVIDYNIGSMKVLLKNGYFKDGVFKNAIFKNGQIYDEHRFYKLKD